MRVSDGFVDGPVKRIDRPVAGRFAEHGRARLYVDDVDLGLGLAGRVDRHRPVVQSEMYLLRLIGTMQDKVLQIIVEDLALTVGQTREACEQCISLFFGDVEAELLQDRKSV